MRVAVIGAGAAGLTSAKNAKEKGIDCVVYEQWSEIGGVWVYTDYTDFDQFGYPILNPMYNGLITNLPKEIMCFSDFPFPKKAKSYLTQQEILDYLKLYAEKFNLIPLIKFNTLITCIKPSPNNKWSIASENKISKSITTEEYDAVMICVGHYHTPKFPKIPGMESFKGDQIHSKSYRRSAKYKGKIVLIIGGGASGIDIVSQISTVAEMVIFNYQSSISKRTYPKNVFIKQSIIKRINENSVIFEDGTQMYMDSIIYCTGYYYNYPFLHKSCGIQDGNFVRPLYKHTVNINHPTMAFIGLPIYISPFITYDLQARFFINHLLQIATFPTKKEMMDDLKKDFNERKLNGLLGQKFHSFQNCQESFYNDLSRLGKTQNVSEVICSIYKKATEKYFGGYDKFKEDVYEIIDSKNFICKK